MDLLIIISSLMGILLFLGGIFLLRIKPEFILGLHILGRVVLDSIYSVSYGEVFAGITIMQLYSVAWSVLFIIYILYYRNGNIHFPRITFAVVLLVFSCGISAMVNLTGMYFLQSIMKWFYFLSAVLFCINTLERCTPHRLFIIVLFSSLYLYANQIIFGLTSGPKISHGIANYIGSYYHEAGFSSLVLLMMACTIGLYMNSKRCVIKISLLLYLLFQFGSLAMAGYRTAVLAGLTMIAAYLFFQSFKRVEYTLGYLFIAFISFLSLVWIGLSGGLSLFDDIGRFVSNPGSYLDFSGSGGNKEILTGRVYLLNMIIYHYLNSDISQQIAGMGAGVAQELIGAYAHNELISALAENGVIGVIVFIYFHVKIIQVCLSGKRVDSTHGYLSLAVMLSVVVLSLATMPYHDMRALLFLGVMYSFADSLSIRHRQKKNIRNSNKDISSSLFRHHPV